MNILAIETSTILGGVALMRDSTLVAELRLNVKVTHSERLMSAIDQVLTGSGMSISDIDAVGISAGPGSFTGLRVGLSTAKGLVYATGSKLITVPTLEAFAWNVPFSGHPVCPLLDARRKEVYAGLFSWTGENFERIIPEQALPVAALLENIKDTTVFLGEGALIYQDIIVGRLGGKALFGSPQHMVPSPSNVAILAMRKAAAGEFADPVAAVPRYYRKSEAETKFGK